ncbi:MAG: hypothetical protein PWQ54_2044 [Bacteroidales bacterium]|jgi:hypothetical protein|nr:hypothetical protein [Bacteroidales bacterium]
MPKLDRTGPEGKGPKTGRGLGKGRTIDGDELLEKLGKGLGKRRHSDCAEGKGKRLNYYKLNK